MALVELNPLEQLTAAFQLTDSEAIAELVAQTPSTILQSDALLKVICMLALPQAPDYLDAILTHTNVHVNFLYRDCVFTFLQAITDVLQENRPAASSSEEALTVALRTSTLRFIETLAEAPEHFRLTFTPTVTQQLPPDVLYGNETYADYDGYVTTADSRSETFFSNGYRILDVLIKHGLWQERLDYITEQDASRYLGQLLNLVQTTDQPRVRSYLLYVMCQLITLGVSPYSDIIFTTLHDLLRAGAVKTVDDLDDAPESSETNFNRITDILTALIAVGYDINYQYMRTLSFADRFGVVRHLGEGELQLETVSYTGVSLLALAAIYNRLDVLDWLLQFYGPLPVDHAEEQLTGRVLELNSPVTKVNPDSLDSDANFYTFVTRLYSDVNTVSDQCEFERVDAELSACVESNTLTVLELARLHRSEECWRRLQSYEQFLTEHWTELDPLQHDLRLIAY